MKSPININLNQLLTQESITQTLIDNALKENNFILPVKVVAIDAKNQTVNVKSLVLKETTDGEQIESSVVYNVSYIRTQSGKSAIIIDPSVDDIGLLLVCDRDMSTVKSTKMAAVPASGRIHSLSDSVYLCGILNQTPTQYIKFTENGVEITSTKEIAVSAPSVKISGSVTLEPDSDGNGEITVNVPINSTKKITTTDEISALDVKAGVVSLLTHIHSGVQNGSGVTGVPQ